ncbi:MAG: cytidine deaminase [Mediterranea massiliensis]|nr:cytidine deaminase [Mediterranea massiliensis]
MKEQHIDIQIRIFSPEEMHKEDVSLIEKAIEATRRSYAPYSHFSVGAAARLADGTIVCGSNQENAAYPSGICAERTTLFYAHSQHPTEAIDVLAIAARNEKGELVKRPISPCGACRQVMLESEHRFKHPMRILLYGTEGVYEILGVTSLLPLSFDADAMI